MHASSLVFFWEVLNRSQCLTDFVGFIEREQVELVFWMEIENIRADYGKSFQNKVKCFCTDAKKATDMPVKSSRAEPDLKSILFYLS